MSNPKKHSIKSLVLEEVSFVDTPAQEGATVVVIKNMDDEDVDTSTAKGMFLDQVARWDTIDPIRGLLNSLYDNNHNLQEAVKAAFTFSTVKNKESAIRQIIKEFVTSLDDLSDSIVNSIPLSKRGKDMNAEDIKKMVVESISSLVKAGNKEDNDSPTTLTEEQVAKIAEQVSEQVIAKDDSVSKIAKMKPEYQSYLAKVAEDKDITDEVRKQKTEYFLSDGVADSHRDALVVAEGIEVTAKSTESDTYTDATGRILKRADLGAAYDTTVAIVKQNDELTKKLSDVIIERDDRNLLQKAKSDYPNLPGSDEERLALLKSVGGITDEKVRDGVLKNIKSCDAAVGGIMKSLGNANSIPSSSGAAVQELANSIKKKHDESGTPITIEKAYSMALNSEAGEKAYDEARDNQGAATTSAH